MSGIRRRELITLFGGAASWPFVARAEQSARPVIGLMHATIQANDEYVAAFKDGLGQTGYVDGRNVIIEFRSAEDQYDRLPAIAAEFVRRPVTPPARQSRRSQPSGRPRRSRSSSPWAATRPGTGWSPVSVGQAAISLVSRSIAIC